MKLSIIIINYNVTDLLRKCLSSIEKYVQNIDYEVIVRDNCSPDSSWKDLAAEFPKIHFVASESNDGFAVANNKAAATAKGDYLLLLNPDTELEGFYMPELVQFAEKQDHFGCLGISMHDSEGRFLPESKRSVPNLFNSFEKFFIDFRKKSPKSYYRNDIGNEEIAEVDVVTGAFLLVKRMVYKEMGGLDERYFMYGEDIDFCYTLLKRGFNNWYYGKASMLHYKGESTVKDEKYLHIFYGAMQIFLDKYYGRKKPVQHLILSAGLKVQHLFEKNRLK